jgi:hypothetical protein
VPGVLLLFAVWANLHGGFVAGLLLIAVITGGLTLDRWRRHPAAVGTPRLVALGLTGGLAAMTATLATPLGDSIWAYLLSFRNPAIARISGEWRSAFDSPTALAYLGLGAAFSLWLWSRARAPRALTPLLTSLAFLLFGVVALRNLIFVGPAIGLQIACSAPDRNGPRPRPAVALAAVATVLATLIWAGTVGPARNARPLGSALVGYALRHPPSKGRIASYAGVGSYLLWRAPKTRVVLDGWLEHFSVGQLRRTYSVLDGRRANPTRYVWRLGIGAVIANRANAIRALEQHGFATEFSTPVGSYLVQRRDAMASGARCRHRDRRSLDRIHSLAVIWGKELLGGLHAPHRPLSTAHRSPTPKLSAPCPPGPGSTSS